jgi:hypothetical protein
MLLLYNVHASKTVNSIAIFAFCMLCFFKSSDQLVRYLSEEVGRFRLIGMFAGSTAVQRDLTAACSTLLWRCIACVRTSRTFDERSVTAAACRLIFTLFLYSSLLVESHCIVSITEAIFDPSTQQDVHISKLCCYDDTEVG